MTVPEVPDTAPRGRGPIPRFAAAVAVFVVVVGLVLALGLANGWFDFTGGASNKPAATSTPTPTAKPLTLPTATPGPIGNEDESVDAVDTTLDSFILATNQVLQRGDGSIDGAETVAAGFVLGELQALAAERKSLGYKQVGDAEITEVTVGAVDLTASPPTMTLTVCVDTSDVDVVDESGTSLKDRMYTPGHPVQHTYGAQFLNGLWKIVTHEIPEKGTCS
ncbi:hypothetical protein IWX78_001845 [Mycetocola sp. CAN_C7]|uniref:hypothetical protein n=1 Tax=Mycetocola sp. CAN_C7 TaxID=2787724 RepID=UPI0018CA016A